LRCSSDAAADLKRAIDSALALAKRTPHGESRFAMVAGDRNIHAPRLPPFVITMPYDAPKRRKRTSASRCGGIEEFNRHAEERYELAASPSQEFRIARQR
jgi:hypothetical protein